MRRADGEPLLIDGRPVEFQPAFQLGVLMDAALILTGALRFWA